MPVVGFLVVVRRCVSGGRCTSVGGEIFDLSHCHGGSGPTSKHPLNKRCSVRESACLREACCLQHHVIHFEVAFFFGHAALDPNRSARSIFVCGVTACCERGPRCPLELHETRPAQCPRRLWRVRARE